MKPSPSPSRSASPASRSGAKATKAKAASSAHPANVRSVERRARKKADRRRKAWIALLCFCAGTAIIGGAAAGVRSELKGANARVASKQTTLEALQAQLAQGKKRLSAFNGGSGRERALAENGFIRPGERILLFPRKDKSAQ